MKNEIIIRSAEMEDIPTLVKFRIQLQTHMEEDNDIIFRFKNNWKDSLLNFYKTKINEKSSLVIVAQVNKVIIGMAVATETSHDDFKISKSVKIDDVWVEKEFRLNGICRKLITNIFEHFRDIKSFGLNYVNSNIEAAKVWKKLGFIPAIQYSVSHKM